MTLAARLQTLPLRSYAILLSPDFYENVWDNCSNSHISLWNYWQIIDDHVRIINQMGWTPVNQFQWNKRPKIIDQSCTFSPHPTVIVLGRKVDARITKPYLFFPCNVCFDFCQTKRQDHIEIDSVVVTLIHQGGFRIFWNMREVSLDITENRIHVWQWC